MNEKPSLAEIAYNAFRKNSLALNVVIAPGAEWEDLSPMARMVWHDVAEAAVMGSEWMACQETRLLMAAQIAAGMVAGNSAGRYVGASMDVLADRSLQLADAIIAAARRTKIPTME